VRKSVPIIHEECRRALHLPLPSAPEIKCAIPNEECRGGLLLSLS